jgi:hypothetical protein
MASSGEWQGLQWPDGLGKACASGSALCPAIHSPLASVTQNPVPQHLVRRLIGHVPNVCSAGKRNSVSPGITVTTFDPRAGIRPCRAQQAPVSALILRQHGSNMVSWQECVGQASKHPRKPTPEIGQHRQPETTAKDQHTDCGNEPDRNSDKYECS